MQRTKLPWLVVCAVAAAGTVAATVSHTSAAGDPAAKAEVIAAFQKLFALPSFKIKWNAAEGEGLAEFIQPDKRHFAAKGPKGGMEIYQIGTETRSHYDFPGAPSDWRCYTAKTPPRQLFDVDKARKDWDTEAGRLPDTVIDGMPVRGYTDVKKGGELYIGAQNGLPRRVVEPNKKFTADFYDYGVPIAFNPPPCG